MEEDASWRQVTERERLINLFHPDSSPESHGSLFFSPPLQRCPPSVRRPKTHKHESLESERQPLIQSRAFSMWLLQCQWEGGGGEAAITVIFLYKLWVHTCYISPGTPGSNYGLVWRGLFFSRQTPVTLPRTCACSDGSIKVKTSSVSIRTKSGSED